MRIGAIPDICRDDISSSAYRNVDQLEIWSTSCRLLLLRPSALYRGSITGPEGIDGLRAHRTLSGELRLNESWPASDISTCLRPRSVASTSVPTTLTNTPLAHLAPPYRTPAQT